MNSYLTLYDLVDTKVDLTADILFKVGTSTVKFSLWTDGVLYTVIFGTTGLVSIEELI